MIGPTLRRGDQVLVRHRTPRTHAALTDAGQLTGGPTVTADGRGRWQLLQFATRKRRNYRVTIREENVEWILKLDGPLRSIVQRWWHVCDDDMRSAMAKRRCGEARRSLLRILMHRLGPEAPRDDVAVHSWPDLAALLADKQAREERSS